MISVFQKIGVLRDRRLHRAIVVLVLGAIEVACSDVYRPIVQPVQPPPPGPGAFHFVVAVATNGSDVQSGGGCSPSGLLPPCQADPGTASRIDVSGDTYAGQFTTGVGPVHAALTTDGSKLYVPNFREDTVSVTSNATSTVFSTVSLPAGSEPVFAGTADSGNMYVANYGNNTVSAINITSDVVTGTLSVGAQPVALAEMPNFQKLYVANQGSGTITVINVAGFTLRTTIAVGGTPVWMVARPDSAKVYVLDNSGTIYEIDTLADTAVTVPVIDGASVALGAGANFMAYDPVVQRLYVTNPATGRVAILSTATGTNPPAVLKVIDLSQGPNAPCPTLCSPVAVTGIGDGSRAYFVSYQLATCTDFLLNSFPCVSTQVEVMNTGTNAISKVIPTTTNVPVDATNPTDSGPATGPPSAAAWTPGYARFRDFVASSGGGSTTNFKVYVSQCDAGSVAIIDAFADNSASPPHPADVYTLSLAAPLSAFPPVQTSISGATFSGGSTTYAYTLTSGPGLQVGMNVYVTGMLDTGNNGYFVISSMGAGTFTVVNPAGVPAASQSGTGLVMPPQNPIFLVAGP
jgi:YVTN family beta-propeller protein